MNIKENMLIIDCETRWNSTYDMFERIIEQRLPVLHDPNFTKMEDARVLSLSDDQMKIIEGLVPVLKPLYIATRTMCSELYPTVGGVYPILYSIIRHHLKANSTDSTVSELKADVHADLVKRHGVESDDICTSLPILCTFLDPRYRSLPFFSPEQRSRVHTEILAQITKFDYSCTLNDSQTPSPSKRCKLQSQDDMAFL
jgi:hypothetical protein